MKKIIFPILALSLIASTICCQEKIDDEKEMKALADKYLELWNEGNLSLCDEILSPEIVRHTVDIYEDIIGIEAFKEYVTSMRTTFPDFNATLDELIIKGDNIVARWTVTGTNTGPFGDLPPTGKKVKYSGVNISHVIDGKLIEEWVYFNQAAFLTQLGFTITPPETQMDQDIDPNIEQ